jgi:hypothetical protein
LKIVFKGLPSALGAECLPKSFSLHFEVDVLPTLACALDCSQASASSCLFSLFLFPSVRSLQGFALLCVTYATSDCTIETHVKDEIDALL